MRSSDVAEKKSRCRSHFLNIREFLCIAWDSILHNIATFLHVPLIGVSKRANSVCGRADLLRVPFSSGWNGPCFVSAITIDKLSNGVVSIIHKIMKQSTLVKYKIADLY